MCPDVTFKNRAVPGIRGPAGSRSAITPMLRTSTASAGHRFESSRVGRTFRNANPPTVLGRPISLGLPDAHEGVRDAPIDQPQTRERTS